MPDREWDTDVWVADPTEIQASIGWKPAFEVDDGLRAFADWLTSDASRRDFYETTRTPPQ